MLVKQKIGGTVAICAIAFATIAYAHSAQFREAESLAVKGLSDEDKDKPFDMVLHTPEGYADPDGTDLLYPEQIATTVRTDNVIGQPLAVLITNDSERVGGTCFQFLYSGDRVEVLTDNGQILAVASGGTSS